MKFISVILVLMFACSAVYALNDDSLVLYCPFEEGSGDTVNDLKSGLAGFISGAKWTKDGKIGGAIEFTNTTDYIEFGKENVLNIEDEITMEAWVFVNEVQEDSGIMGRRSQPNVGGYCMQWTNGMFEMWLNVDGGGWKGTRDMQTINTKVGEWYHVACVFDGKDEFQYVNGELDVKLSAPGRIAPINEVFRIGQAQTELDSVLGRVDEVAVYKRALSLNEIKEDMGKGVLSPVSPVGNLASTWGYIKR